MELRRCQMDDDDWGDDTVFLRVVVLGANDASLWVEDPFGETFTVPRSQVRDHEDVCEVLDQKGDKGILCIPRWLALDREVDYWEEPDEV